MPVSPASPDSLLEKVKCALELELGSLGLVKIKVSGATVSTVQV